MNTPPPELQIPLPRDPGAAAALQRRNRSIFRHKVAGACVLAPLVGGLVYWVLGERMGLSIALAVAAAAPNGLSAVALFVHEGRSVRIFRNGTVLAGKVARRKEMSSDGSEHTIRVEFQDEHERMLVGEAAIVSTFWVAGKPPVAGREVIVVHVEGDEKEFALYTEGLGLVAGRILKVADRVV